MTATTTERINHSEQVGTVEDLGTIQALPKRPITAPPGRGRQHNPFDDLVLLTVQTGLPRLAVADDLESAKVLIRRATARAGLGVDMLMTVTEDGRDAIAYLARPKRVRKSSTTQTPAVAPQPSEAADGMESYDEDTDYE